MPLKDRKLVSTLFSFPPLFFCLSVLFFSFLLSICLFGSLFIHGFISMFFAFGARVVVGCFFLKGGGEIAFLSPPLILFCCLISPERLVQLVIEYRKKERSGGEGVGAIEEKGRRKIQSLS